MVYKQTAIIGVYILEPKVFCDDRGYFYEVWKEHDFNDNIGRVNFIQDNESKSKYGVLINGLDDSDNVYNINVKDCRFGGLTAEPLMRTGKSHDIKMDNVTVSTYIK